MSRPAGDPGALAAGARGMSAAAGALRDVGGRVRGATSFVVVAGAWKGPASEAFLVDGAGQQAAVGRAAAALDQAAGALSELSARLEHAQSTWDRAQRLAASAGVTLDGSGTGDALRSAWNPHGGVRSPADAVDPAAMLVGGQAVRMAEAAEHEAAAARRAAAARFDQAATALRAPAHGGHGGHEPGRSRSREGGHGGGEQGHGGLVERAVGRVLEAGAEVATATHHLVTAAEARVQAAVRLAGTADDPAVRSAAGRVAQAAGRPLIDGRVLGALPLAAPIMDFTASVSHGEAAPPGVRRSARGRDRRRPRRPGRPGRLRRRGRRDPGRRPVRLPGPHRRRRRPRRPGRQGRRPPRLRQDRRPPRGGTGGTRVGGRGGYAGVAARVGVGRVRRWGWV